MFDHDPYLKVGARVQASRGKFKDQWGVIKSIAWKQYMRQQVFPFIEVEFESGKATYRPRILRADISFHPQTD